MNMSIVIPLAIDTPDVATCIQQIHNLLPTSAIHVLMMCMRSEPLPANIHIHPLLSAARARNLGADLVDSKYVLFLDPDNQLQCRLPEVAQLALNHAMDANPDLIVLQRAEAQRTIANLSPTRWNFAQHCIEWNCIWRCDHFLRLGGFDENLGPGCSTLAQAGEGFDLCFRHFANQDHKTVYVPDIAVKHPTLDNSQASSRRQMEYAYGSAYASFSQLRKSPSALSAFWFARSLVGVLRDASRPIERRARAMALYDALLRVAPRPR